MITCWVLLPLAFAALSAGWGVLLARAGNVSPPPALLLPLGFAAITAVTVLATVLDATAELAVPVVIAGGAAGLAWGLGTGSLRLDGWALAAAGVVFLVYGAPVIASGEATFAGYTKLDDTATWLAVTDRMIEHGRDLHGLRPSTYQRVLDAYLGGWYPDGAFPPLGVAGRIAGEDVAWVIQPYLAMLAGMLTLVLSSIAARVLRSRRLAALAAAIAAQPALLVGYALWGGLKELAAVPLIALAAVLAADAASKRELGRAAIPLAVTVGSLISVLTLGGLAWLAPLVLGVAVVAVRNDWPWRGTLRAAAVVALFMLAVGTPVLLVGGGVPSLSSDLGNGTLGTLFHPLNVLQVEGIWPTGDFRTGPRAPVLTYLAIVVVVAAAAYGLWWSWSRGKWPLLFYGLAGGVGLATILAFGSPWIDAKAMAIASPAILLLATVGALLLVEGGRRVEGGVAIVVLVLGVGWSNVLAYDGAKLAPRDQFVELESIGGDLAGEGPTLITEFQPYGARHFLRDADAESVSELRVRAIPQRNGRPVALGESADTDALRFDDLRQYRTLVIRRSPSASRPPADYRLVRRGDYYEVWQRPAGPPAPASHLALGPTGRGDIARTSVPSCSDVLALARFAGSGGELVASGGVQPIVPSNGSVEIHRPGRYGIWLLGSVMGQVTAYVDGSEVGRVRHRINRTGNYIELGAVDLSRGRHRIRASFSGGDIHPGSGAEPTPVGPLVLGRSAADGTRLIRVRGSDARSLCGRSWDWIEAPQQGPPRR